MKILFLTLLFFAAAVFVYNAVISFLMHRDNKRCPRCKQTGIIKGAAPVYLSGSRKHAVLCVHGYIGSPTDFETLPEKLCAAGYTVSVPLLPGHGTCPRDFASVTADELEAFVCAEYDRLCEQYEEVTVIGFSMGAALVTLLAAKRPLRRVIMLAPYYAITNAWKYVLPVAWYVKFLSGIIPFMYRPRVFKQLNDRSRVEGIIDYDFISLKGTQAAMRISALARRAAAHLPQATLIIHSRGDQATDFKTAESIAAQRGFCFRALEKSNHMLLWDYEREEAVREVFDFLGAGQ